MLAHTIAIFMALWTLLALPFNVMLAIVTQMHLAASLIDLGTRFINGTLSSCSTNRPK